MSAAVPTFDHTELVLCRCSRCRVAELRTFRVHVISRGVATITAPTKAHASHRARAGDFDSYELQAPEASITSLAEGEPVAHMLPPVPRPVVYRSTEA